jgi:hypothetical protein
MDNILTSLAIQMRDVMRNVSDVDLSVNGTGAGLAYMKQIGYSDVVATSNPNNPGGITDAAWALQVLQFLNTNSKVYFGLLQQGGTGGTGATIQNFNQQLAGVWGGRVV